MMEDQVIFLSGFFVVSAFFCGKFWFAENKVNGNQFKRNSS